MSDIVDEARRLLAAATPGPWFEDRHAFGFGVNDRASGDYPVRICWVEGKDVKQEHADAAFIAASPRLVAGLIAEVECGVAGFVAAHDGWREAIALIGRIRDRAAEWEQDVATLTRERDEARAALAELVRTCDWDTEEMYEHAGLAWDEARRIVGDPLHCTGTARDCTCPICNS